MATKHDDMLRNFNIGGRFDANMTDIQVDKIHDVVVNGPKTYNPTMTEHTFRYKFLPVLACQVEDEETLAVYLNGGGGQVNVGVNIVDDEGNFLFEVPPLVSTDHIKPVAAEGETQSFTEIAMNIELLNRRSPAQGRELFRNSVWGRIIRGHNTDFKPTTNERRWLEIFKRYDIKVADLSVVQEENKTGAKPLADSGDGNVETIGEF